MSLSPHVVSSRWRVTKTPSIDTGEVARVMIAMGQKRGNDRTHRDHGKCNSERNGQSRHLREQGTTTTLQGEEIVDQFSELELDENTHTNQ
jgi:hypothetical protein